MLPYLVAFLGGVLTLVSPCILPVLPFVFVRADRPFARNGLPLLAGMAVMFTAVASLAAVGGGWVVDANRTGRAVALLLMGAFGLSLLVPRIGDLLTRPLVRVGERLVRSADPGDGGIASSLVLGAATGLLWTPCAGPILGLVFTGAALRGASAQTSLLLFAYAAGAATSLAAALWAGRRVLRAMHASLGVGERLRRALGAVLLASVAAIALGLDTTALAAWSADLTTGAEQRLLDTLHGDPAPSSSSSLIHPESP